MAAKINWHRYGTIIMSLLPYKYPFNGLFSWTSWVSQYGTRKVKPVWILDLNDARDGGVLGWQWHQLDHMQTICTPFQADNHTNTSSLDFYRPDALPDAH